MTDQDHAPGAVDVGHSQPREPPRPSVPPHRPWSPPPGFLGSIPTPETARPRRRSEQPAAYAARAHRQYARELRQANRVNVFPFSRERQGCPGKLKYARERRVFVFCTTLARHGRACPGHPRRAAATNLRNSRLRMGVDARHKAGHDAQGLQQGITSQLMLFSRTALRKAGRGLG
jgi:hypothetical protein